jgi:1-acyl-sn-glycerol-3-phosphate acyltransferase
VNDRRNLAGPPPEPPGPTGAAVGHAIGAVVFRTVYRGRAYGTSNVPRTGPVIYAANHAGFMDGPLVFGLAPRPVHFIVKQEMFHGAVGRFISTMGQIPIDRSVADRGALTAALAVLGRDGVVGIFPEGRRGRGDVAEANAGTVWLALTSGAPVIPVAVLGTRRTGQSISGFPPPLRRVATVFGPPIPLLAPEGVPRRQAMADLTEDLRKHLSAHVLDASERLDLPLPSDDQVETA